MIRTVAGHAGTRLLKLAASEQYPTRTVEHFLAWITVVWSYSVVFHNQMISARVPGNVYGPMLKIMSAQAWAVLAYRWGALRVMALFGNGHWRPSPGLRLIGAGWGMMFWTVLFYCYWVAVSSGAPDFPMRRALLSLCDF